MEHIISKDGVKTDPKKIAKVKNFPVPRNLAQLHGFLVLASYYRRFIKDFLKIINPLNKLLKKIMKKILCKVQGVMKVVYFQFKGPHVG